MPNTFRIKEVRTSKANRCHDQRYIGFVLDAINKYLQWNVQVYYLSLKGEMDLSKRTEGLILEPNNQDDSLYPARDSRREVILRRVDERKLRFSRRRIYTYEIEGFPQEFDFNHFRRSVQKIYKSVVNPKS